MCIPFSNHESPLEVQRLFWTDTAQLGAVIPPTGRPGWQSVCPRFCFSLRPVHFSAMMSCSYPRHTCSVAPSASPLVSNSCFVVFSSEDSLQETRLLLQPLCLEKNALENSWQESEAFVEFHSWPASLCRRVPERSRSARSRPSEQRF